MKILVTGVNGQLGYEVVKELLRRGQEVLGTDRLEDYSGPEDFPKEHFRYFGMDLTDGDAVCKKMDEFCPEAVIHCAAWTAVDAAEDEENRPIVRAVNANGTRFLAQACAKTDIKMLCISTDYVFDGKGTEPWNADCTDYRPLNYYGQTKMEAELAVKELVKKYFIVRIAWAFGKNGTNFVKTMIRVGKNHKEVRVVNDQIGTPTYMPDLAVLLADMIASERYGCYHATNEGGFISWYEFCCEIYRQYGLDTTVIPVTTEEYGLSKAARPQNSRLDKSKLKQNGFETLPDWKDALRRYLEEAEL